MMRFAIPGGGSNPKPARDPERLSEGKFGCLLKDANRQLAGEVDQRAAFQRLTERLSTRRGAFLWPGRVYWLAPVTLLMLVTFAALPRVVRRMRSDLATVVVAEDLRAYHAKSVVPAARPTTDAARPAQPSAAAPAEGRSASSAKRRALGASLVASSSGVSGTVAPSVAQALEPHPAAVPEPSMPAETTREPGLDDGGTTADCLSLARRGQTRDAEACFLKRAQGSGLGAEMALYEVARLRRDVLADAAGALRALAEYRARFPAGSLRREADMSQLELLLQLGRVDEALKQSDELLSSSSSERAAELHLLRGHILRKTRSRYAAAAHEYELAERAGARGGDVIYFHALCLEALGRATEAAALFSQYLEQPQLSHAEDARRRLERLKP